jgi:hypothetical protein
MAAERLEFLKVGVLAEFCVGLTQIILSSLNLWLCLWTGTRPRGNGNST